MSNPRILSVNKSNAYSFSKKSVPEIYLIEGIGIEGDIHSGKLVKHRSRIKRDPTVPNLRQVHLIHAELLDSLSKQGHQIMPGNIGENITTRGIDLLSLSTNTVLQLRDEAQIQVAGLRNPCQQLNNFQEGLMQKLIFKDTTGEITRLAGIMSIVNKSGYVRTGDPITIVNKPSVYKKLEPI